MQAKWIGRPVREHENVFDEIRNVIPHFDRQPFTADGVRNDHLDTIIKLPIDTHDNQVPVATVSKSYSLVQHHDVLIAVERAFNDLGYNTKNAACSLQLTEYGERMWLRVKFAEAHTFDPGDGQPLTLEFHALNSVDRSTTLTFEFGWYRLVCSNGMMRLNSVDRFQRRHTASLTPEILVEYLGDTIADIEREKETYRSWQQQIVRINTDPLILENWIDTTVTNEWERQLAARTYNILRTATDGKVDHNDLRNPELRKTPHKIPVRSQMEVPGARPVENVYDVANALSWISSHQPTLQTRYKRMMEVPELLRKLTNQLG